MGWEQPGIVGKAVPAVRVPAFPLPTAGGSTGQDWRRRWGGSVQATRAECFTHTPVPISREIWNTKDSVVAQTGSGGSFHEFCTSVCLSLYEAQQQRPTTQAGDPADATRCSICQKTGEVRKLAEGLVCRAWLALTCCPWTQGTLQGQTL